MDLQALTGLCEDLEDVAGLALPAHWARHFFLAALCLELQHNAEALSRLQVINQVSGKIRSGVYESSSYVQKH
jgi:hypothetical protein